MRFAKPPLVELVAELRWGFPALIQPLAGQLQPVDGVAINRHEEFFMRFGAKAAAEGFDRFERLMPSGFPLIPFQPVYRYRYGAPGGTSLYQLGAGVFSANITPPYDNWEKFRPVVERGVSLLLEARADDEKTTPFGTISLRYIDAFGSELMARASAIDFLTGTLGFSLALPAVIHELAMPDAVPTAALQFEIALKENMVLRIQAGEGQVNGQTAVVMDTTAYRAGDVSPAVIDIMDAFDAAHAVIRHAFIGMTGKVSKLMEPQEE